MTSRKWLLLALGAIWAAAPASASAAGTATLAKLAPMSGHTERGVVQLLVRPKESSVRAGVIGGSDTSEFTLALSKRRCRGVAANPADPGWIGETEKNLFDAKPIEGFYIDDIIIGAVPPRNVRAARSMVLLGAGDDGKLEPRACGNTRTAPIAKRSFKPRRRSVLIALLLPFSGHTERANLQLTAGPGSGSDSLALVGDFNRDGDVSYSFRLSQNSCARVESDPAHPGYIGPRLIAPTPFSGTTFDDEAAVTASKSNASKARSIVLVGREGGSKYEPIGCGYVIVLKDVLVTG